MTSTASLIILGWLACFVFTVLLILKDKRPMNTSSLSLLLLIPVAPLSFIALLIFQLVLLEEALLLKRRNRLGNHFMVKYQLFGVLHKLRINNINKVKWR